MSVIQLTMHVPDSLPAARRPALQAVASHCTVHNSLVAGPAVTIGLR